MSALFVTASGTEIGKTLFACRLARQLVAVGRTVRVLKPVISGFDERDAEASDIVRLLRSVGREADRKSIDEVSPWRFAGPLSPDMAAEREGRAIDFDAVVAFCRESRQVAARSGTDLLIEGIGGAMVPLTRDRTVADWIAALEIPAAVVSGSYLGALSHTLTAVECLRTRDVPLAGIVVSESDDSPVPLAETVATLRRFTAGCPVVTLPRVGEGDAVPNDAQDYTHLLQ